MPRRTDEPLDRYMRFRCTEAEGARLMRRAAAEAVTFSEFARRQLLPAKHLRRRGGETVTSAPETNASTEAKALAFQIQKIGVNLNQIVKSMHQHQAPPPAELAPLLADIRAYVRRAQHLPKFAP